jgi:uncharacterized protein (PEP-CTERM system associated)
LDFNPSYQKFAIASDQDRFDTNLTAAGTAALWPEHLLFNGSASLSHQVINSRGALTTSGISQDTNQADVQTYTLGPTFAWRFGDFASGKVNYVFGQTDSGGALASATENVVGATLTGGPQFGRLGWQASIQNQQIDQSSASNAGQTVNNNFVSGVTSNSRQRTALINTQYAINRWLAFLSGFGYEKIDNGTLASKISGPIGSVGIGITGSYLEANINYNWRFGGEFVSLDATYTLTQQLQVKANYSESVTTSQQQAFQSVTNITITPTGAFHDPRGFNFNASNSLEGINGGQQNSAFHSKIGQVSLIGVSGRNTFTAAIRTESSATETSVPTGSIVGASNFNSTAAGLIGQVNHAITEEKSVSGTVNYTRLHERSPQASTDNTYSASVAYNLLLARDVTASAAYNFLYRQSSLPGQNITENSVTLSLHKNF